MPIFGLFGEEWEQPGSGCYPADANQCSSRSCSHSGDCIPGLTRPLFPLGPRSFSPCLFFFRFFSFFFPFSFFFMFIRIFDAHHTWAEEDINLTIRDDFLGALPLSPQTQLDLAPMHHTPHAMRCRFLGVDVRSTRISSKAGLAGRIPSARPLD